MLTAKMNYEVKANGERLDTHENLYGEHLAADISKYSVECPHGHEKYPPVEIELGIVNQPDRSKRVELISINNSCCEDFTTLIRKNIIKDLIF